MLGHVFVLWLLCKTEEQLTHSFHYDKLMCSVTEEEEGSEEGELNMMSCLTRLNISAARSISYFNQAARVQQVDKWTQMFRSCDPKLNQND